MRRLPHRIGRASIDGVADPISWANEPSHKWHKGWTSSAEKTYDWFLTNCTNVRVLITSIRDISPTKVSQAGPEYCPLARRRDEAKERIEKRIEDFIASLVYKPLAVSGGPRPGYITSGAARGA
jgi:hypothetical protein